MFTIENGVVRANPETLAIYPYSEIWKRDTSAHKERANSDFKFIEFFCSPKRGNPFFGYPRGRIRADKIIANIRETYTQFDANDPLLFKAVELYDEFWNNASPELSYYQSTLVAAKKVEEFFRDFDMGATNARTGAPIYKPKEITSALVDTQNVLKSLAAIKEQVYQEIYDSAKSKGNRQVNTFER
jgi:hypothetical protein